MQVIYGELAKYSTSLSLVPYHPDVPLLRLHRPAQHAHVVAVTAGGNHDVRRLRWNKPRHRLLEIFSDDLFRFGKALTVRVGLAIINHGHVETSVSGNLVKIY